MPDCGISQTVCVRIGRLNIRGHIRSQIPDWTAVARHLDGQIDCRQIARMIPIPRADQQGHNILRLNTQRFDRLNNNHLSPMRNPGPQSLTRGTSPQFQRPGNSVTAFGMSMLDLGFDSDGRIHRTPPTDDRLECRSGMDGDSVRLHISRNSNGLIRGIGNDQRRCIAAPAIHKGVTGRVRNLAGKMVFDFDGTTCSHTEIIQPGSEDLDVHIMAFGQLCQFDFSLRRSRFSSRVQAFYGAGKGLLATFCQLCSDVAHVAQENIRTPGSDQPGFVPDDEIVVISVSCIHRRQVDCDSLTIGRGG